MGIFWTTGSKKGFWAALSLLGPLLICYANSFQAAWIYDDFVNIVNNPNVHMADMSWSRICHALKAGPEFQIVGRPLAYLSFALNYWIGGDNPLGYHLVNFAIHYLAAWVLFLLVRDTLRLPIFNGHYTANAVVIAWLAALFWACHPIQVTAVTYIVQRMTAMAGLFYIATLYAYLLGRRADRHQGRIWAYGLCALSGVCAMLTKENAVLLPYTILLYELLFFRRLNRRTLAKALLAALGLTAIILLLSTLYTTPSKLLAPYSNRPFTMVERVMTQPRVLFTYLELLAVPMVSRMSILHDVVVSRSLLIPWTTLPAILGVMVSILMLGLLARRHRLFAFCGLFFFLNHGVESSILNLDLIYEHRNYVPSMFLFVPLAVGIVRAMAFFYYRGALRIMIAGCVGLLLITRAQTTYEYNRLFASEYQLWQHATLRYPNNSLAHNNLGKAYWDAGDFAHSHQSILQAVALDRFNNTHQKATAYFNLGVHEANEKDYAAALALFDRARGFSDEFPEVWQWIARVRIQMGNFDGAETILSEALERWPDNLLLNGMQAINKMKRGEYAAAMTFSGTALAAGRVEERVALMVIAQSHWLSGEHAAAIDTWQRLLEKEPGNTAALLALAEMHAKLGQSDKAISYLRRLLDIKGIDYLRKAVTFEIKAEYIMPYVPDDKIINQLVQKMDLNE